MSYDKNTIEAFLALVRLGLGFGTSKDAEIPKEVAWDELYQLASEQSVLGLVLAGLERSDVKPPKPVLLQWIGEVQMLEHRNQAMNYFIGVVVEKMREAGIETLLVKGQGVAHCYERPLWRSCGDVDFLLDVANYKKAKAFLTPLAASVDDEDTRKMHFGMTIDPWVVELHGRFPFAMSEKVERVVDEVIEIAHVNHMYLTDDMKSVAVPKADEHVFLVFTHFLHHFFIEGVGLRQICDWCRMLWTYKDSLNYGLLESRIKRAGLMSEWKVFGAMAVEYLGMPEEAMPICDSSFRIQVLGSRVLARIIKIGNFGHNNDVSYRGKYSGFVANMITFFRRMWDFMKFALLFPLDSPRFFVTYVRGKSEGLSRLHNILIINK